MKLKPQFEITVYVFRRFVKEDHLLYHNMTHSKEVDENGHPFFICPETECKEGAQFKTLVWVEFKQHAWKEHSVRRVIAKIVWILLTQ